MTNIRLIYNPYTKKVQIYNEHNEITAAENKIYTFLNTSGFACCLMPFRKRYTIWEGLLLELLEEFNDEELSITFEGRKADYQRLEDSFLQLKPAVENAGYQNLWQIFFVQNFEAADIAKQLAQDAEDLREMCECRAELTAVDNLIAAISEEHLLENCSQFKTILSDHIAKWQQSSSSYRQEKIICLKILEEKIAEFMEQMKECKL